MTPYRSTTLVLLPLFHLLAAVGTAQTGGWMPDRAEAKTCHHFIEFGTGELTGPRAEFSRAAELTGVAPLQARLIRSGSASLGLTLCEPEESPWKGLPLPALDEDDLSIGVITPRLRTYHNSAYPDSRNNGALWTGRGLSAEFSAGVTLAWRNISAALIPSFIYQENRAFETITSVRPPGYSPFIYPWHPGKIDWPQRPGEYSSTSYHPGQSHLRLEYRGLDLRLATENLWWGPAQRYPLLLGNNAPGFTHLSLGTAEPSLTPLGELEARIVWGRLKESPHFDGDRSNDRRLFAGLITSLQPERVPGLYLGLAFIRVAQLEGLGLHRQLIAPLVKTPRGDEPHPEYHLFSLSSRWAFSETGFEFYGEWGTNASWAGIGDFLREPGRGMAFTLGVQQVSQTRYGWIRSWGELTALGGSPKAPADGGRNAFYTDERVPQGHTHRGQLLGAAIGPGSDAQILGVDLFSDWGKIGLFAERIRRDEDAYFTVWTRYYGRDAHDIALATGVQSLVFLGPLEIGSKIRYESRKNRNFLRLDGYNWELLSETNWRIDLEIGWRPGTIRRTLRPTIAGQPTPPEPKVTER